MGVAPAPLPIGPQIFVLFGLLICVFVAIKGMIAYFLCIQRLLTK